MHGSFPFSPNIPVVETDRLRIRGHAVEDASKVSALWSSPEVTRYIGGKALTDEECWSRLLRYVGHWSLLGFGYWILEERATGEFVGEVGFSDYKRDVEPALGAVPEVLRMGAHSPETWDGLCDRGCACSTGLGT